MTSIDVLSDDVLLVIFDFYVVRISKRKSDIEAWQSLVHVCRRWRRLWPALPLIVYGYIMFLFSNIDNVIAALGQSNRVCDVFLPRLESWQLEQVLAVMQVPFPELTDLGLFSNYETHITIPGSFLGGSAPRLRSFSLDGILFPGLPKLLLSATHLVDLCLRGYISPISPEAMATCLSVLTSLDTLCLEFRSSRSGPDRESRRLPPMTRSILPDLTNIRFNGASEYFEYLVARIDAPRLDDLDITFFPQMNFDTPHLVQFISRTPRFKEPNEAHVSLNPDAVVQLLWASDDHWRLSVEISCEESDPQLSSIAQVYTMCLPSLPTVENLRLRYLYSEMDWNDDVDQWLELLRPFTAVKSLYISDGFRPPMVSVLQELVGGRTTEVLPSLQNIFLTKPGAFRKAIAQFVAARQLSGRPIAVLR